ncbi:PilZ domain-containing protein [Eionea flava]
MSTLYDPNDKNDSEKRRFTRVAFVSHISLSKEKENFQWEGTVVDISFNGILVNIDTESSIGEMGAIINATIHFENDARIDATLQFAHHHDKFYGFSFHEIDSDSLMHLRRIIEHNLGDSSICERELLTLFRYHQ